MDQKSLGFDPHTPNVARLYDYYLGGKDHFPADREAAELVLRAAPGMRAAARANRAFLGRAVRHLAEAGIRQFLDLGTGLPAQESVDQVAAKVAPDSRVVYVDLDPVVLVHARALLCGRPGTVVAQGDLRKPRDVIGHPEVLGAIDFSRPVGVLLVAVMHFVADADRPREILATLREAMAPGSYLVLSHAALDAFRARADAAERVTEVYERSNAPLTLRGRERILELFDGFALEDPGLVWLPEWHPEPADTVDFVAAPDASLTLCGVARKI